MQMSDASSHFGPYRLLAPIGEGGMGRVWKALDTRLERVVALKLLKGDTPENRALLIREARTACQLQHPHIAIVFEAGELEGQPFMAMEYVEGSSLDHFRGRPMELSGLMRLALQACSALYHAHQKGIIHRDIKPENLVLTKDGQLKILDFGVAKRIQDAEPTAQDLMQAQATRQSNSVGTPSYMSPEQVYALNQCPASDQFSLAVVLYEMATGRHPFRKLSLLETLQSIAKDKHTDPGVFRKELPEIFIRCLDRMLSKDASGRFKDLQEPLPLFEDLKTQYLTGSTPALVSARKSRFPRSWKLGLGLCLVAGASAIVWFHLKAFESPIKTSEKAERKVVAVLPLEMRGVPSELNWTALSFRECMNMGLTRRSDLMVLDRIRIAESTEADAHRTLGDIVQDLGADYLVLCTLQGLGKDLRLYVRLVKGRAGEVVQQFQIHGSCDRILDMEAELTDRLPESLGSLTLPDRPAPRARQVRTRERYAKGLELLYQGDPASYDQAAKLFEEGIQEEPDYAPLHTGLAAAWLYKSVSVSHMGSREIKGLQERALERVSKAIALDDGTAFSYRILCEVLHRLGRFEEARKAGFRAVVLDPADFRCHANLGDTYAYESTPHSQEEAERFYKRAIELCPSDWFAHHRYGVSLQNRGALEEALASNEKARKLQPNAPFTHLTSALCHAWLGRVSEAQACIDEGLLHAPDMPLLRASQAVLAHRRKDFKTFNQAWSGLKTAWPENHSMAVLLKGLELHLTQGLDAAERFYLAHLKASRAQNWAQKTVLEHRTASVNLYHMAQAMAILGRKASAKALLDEAERLQVGKRSIAEKDPAFTGI